MPLIQEWEKPRSPQNERGFKSISAGLTQRFAVTGVALGCVNGFEHGAPFAEEQALGGFGNTTALQRGTTGTIDGHDDNSSLPDGQLFVEARC